MRNVAGWFPLCAAGCTSGTCNWKPQRRWNMKLIHGTTVLIHIHTGPHSYSRQPSTVNTPQNTTRSRCTSALHTCGAETDSSRKTKNRLLLWCSGCHEDEDGGDAPSGRKARVMKEYQLCCGSRWWFSLATYLWDGTPPGPEPLRLGDLLERACGQARPPYRPTQSTQSA
jgi:hypothetical protein